MEQAKKALAGSHTFSQLSLSLMMFRLKRMYEQNPTGATLTKCTEEINAFLDKYSKIMTADYSILSRL